MQETANFEAANSISYRVSEWPVFYVPSNTV